MIPRAAALIVVLAGFAEAHEPITTKLTWTREISRIVYKRCASCHREGGKAPMSLLTYDEARPWAKAIKEEVLERRMPPWGAVKGFGDFRDDASLPEREIELLVHWVEGGAPKGDDIYLPPPPELSAELPPPPPSRRIPLNNATTLAHNVVALGIIPSGPMQVTAHLPGGAVQPLIWVRDIRPEWLRPYYFREPLKLPKGTQIRVSRSDNQKPPSAVLLVSR